MTYYVEVAASLLMNGPTGILVSLGIENIPGVSLAVAYMYYNYIAVCLTFFIAAMAGPRSESRFCILVPIIAGILFGFGWIHTANAASQIQFFALLVIMGIFGIMSYMNDVNHEKHGIGGPGSKLLNLVFFIIIFQVAVGTMNGFSLFEPAGVSQASPNGCAVGYTCDQYGNIQLSESIANLNSSGGLFTDIISLVATLPLIAVALLKFVVTILTSVTLFSVVLNASIAGLYPGITSNTAYIAFLALVQVGIWAIYALTLFTYYYKPMPGEGTI